MRLNRFLAHAGICSRRKADEYILAGQVTVDGEVQREMGFKVQPNAEVRFNGKVIFAEKKMYILLNKPKDIICTTSDEKGRRTIMDIVNIKSQRIYPVGRLDRHTTGLLLMTNDGELAQKLAHPSYEVSKIYQVILDKPLLKKHLVQIMNKGVDLEEGTAMVDNIAYVNGKDKKTIGIELHIGWNRVVRRIFETLGYKVLKLDRILYAGLTKKDLPRGKWRHLEQKEVITLKHFK